MGSAKSSPKPSVNGMAGSQPPSGGSPHCGMASSGRRLSAAEVAFMPGVKGQITRAKSGKQKSVYLSDAFGVWEEGDKLHFTFLKDQTLHTNISKRDGLLYDAIMMLYQHGLRTGESIKADGPA
jgi:hypothetical protein